MYRRAWKRFHNLSKFRLQSQAFSIASFKMIQQKLHIGPIENIRRAHSAQP